MASGDILGDLSGMGGRTPSLSAPPPSTPDAPPPQLKPPGGKISPDPNDPDLREDFAVRFESFCKDKWLSLRLAYTVFHQVCWQDILYYVGMLWIQWDKDRRVFQQQVPEDEWTPMPEINYFSPTADSIASVFQVPEIEAIPKQEDNMMAHEVAEVANCLAQAFMSDNGLRSTKDGKESKGDIAGQFFTLCGNVLTVVEKHENGIRQRQTLETVPMVNVSCPQCNMAQSLPPDHPMLQPPAPSPSDMLMGQPVQPPQPPSCPTCAGPINQSPTQKVQQKKDPLTGAPLTTPVPNVEVRCRVVNPLTYLPRAGAKSQEESRYGQIATRMSLDEIYEEWGYDAQPDNQFLDSSESSWEIALNFYYTGYSTLTEATKDAALVVITFIEPGRVKKLPEGGVGVLVNDKLIHSSTWEDFAPAGHPITFGGYLKAPTTFFYRTPMFDIAKIQKELNRYESLIAMHAMTSASDSVVIDENTVTTDITGRGDRIVRWRSLGPGSKEPHRMQHGSLDNGIYEQRQVLRDQIQNVAATVDVWRGQQAGSVTAGNAISQLRGQAEQMFAKPTDNWRNLWVETVRKAVKLQQITMEAWEIAEIMGQGHDVQILKFKTANLDTLLDWVPTSHGLPRTRDEKRNDLLALYDRQALDINDPNVKIRINELFGETGMEQMFNRDATRARAENDKMRNGQAPVFMPDIEDLQVHLAIHGEHIKRLDFDTYEPPIQEIFIKHFMETKLALATLIQAAQATSGGGPGEGPAPAPAGQQNKGGAPGGGPHSAGGGPRPPGGTQPQPKPTPGKKKPAAPGGAGAGTNKLTVPTGPQGGR